MPLESELIEESLVYPASSGERFMRFMKERNFIGARIELQRLFRETALSTYIPTDPLWGIIDDLEPRHLRGTIGITLEFIGQRTMRYTTIGAILHLNGILTIERSSGKTILTSQEKIRARRLLMVYTLRHPKDVIGTPYALDTIHEHFPLKVLYRNTLKTYKTSGLFAPSIRQRIIDKRLFENKKRPS